MRRINRIILHCSATQDMGDSIGVEEIRSWHVEENGWSDVGYQYVIRRSGLIQKGRADEIPGAHTYGYNYDSIGVCYVGTYRPTYMQLESICSLHKLFKNKYGLNWSQWYAHNQFANKDCPGFDINLIRIMLKYYDLYSNELEGKNRGI